MSPSFGAGHEVRGFARMDQDQSAYHRGVTQMSNNIRNSLTIAFGAAFLGSVSLSNAFSPNAAFQIKPLISGYMLAGDAANSAEGKCGDGKCGIPMMDKDKDGKVSKEESK